jgi:hypothetical protein
MKKVLGTMAILAAVAMGGSAATAGMKRVEPVSVTRNTDGSGYASGSIGSTRNEPSTTSYLTCSLAKFGAGSLQVFCSAQDAGGDYVYAYSTDPDLVRVVGQAGEGSWLNFSWDTSSKITNFTNEVSSWSAPKVL